MDCILVQLLLAILVFFYPIIAFPQGQLIFSQFRGFYCDRPARTRMPIHLCGGGGTPVACQPMPTRAPYQLRVSAGTYWDKPIQVAILSVPGGPPVRGFTISALDEQNNVVGEWDQTADIVTTSCNPSGEGYTAFHAQAQNRTQWMLSWNANSRNEGRIRFIAYAVFEPQIFWELVSPVLTSERDGTKQRDLRKEFEALLRNMNALTPILLPNGTRQTISVDTFISENAFLSRLQGGYDLNRPFDTFDRDAATLGELFPQNNGMNFRNAMGGRISPRGRVNPMINQFGMRNQFPGGQVPGQRPGGFGGPVPGQFGGQTPAGGFGGQIPARQGSGFPGQAAGGFGGPAPGSFGGQVSGGFPGGAGGQGIGAPNGSPQGSLFSVLG